MRLPGPSQPELTGSYEGDNLVRPGGAVAAVPLPAPPVDLKREEDFGRDGVMRGQTREEVRERRAAARDAVPVEFAGWLPAFEHAGNCGRHPQFHHTASPPAGYRFTCSAPRLSGPPPRPLAIDRILQGVSRAVRDVGLLFRPLLIAFRGGSGVAPRARLRVLAAMLRLFCTLRDKGCRLVPVLRFLRSRHYQSQLLLPDRRGLVFLPSMPFTYGQNPWVVEIEDPTTLFYPFIQNGGTSKTCVTDSPYFPIVKTLLESDQCKGIITHMKSTAALVPTLFGSDKIRRKVFHVPLGIKLPERRQCHEGPENAPLHLLFTNSWHQMPGNFILRGGLDVLEAFSKLRKHYPHLRLTLRTRLPGLPARYHRMIEAGWVRVIDRFLSVREMDNLLAGSHIFLLPAARVHVVSLLQAMGYGLAVVASDGWGMEEYLTHERNGLVVKGRYGKISWADEEAGMLREDYSPMNKPDRQVVHGLVEAVSQLVEDRNLRQRLGRTARHDVQTTFNLERWNAGLKQALDRALAPRP